MPEGYEHIAAEMLDADTDAPVRTEGATWQTVVPTALIVLQAQSGAVAGVGLPCNCPPAQADGTDVAILTQLKQSVVPRHCGQEAATEEVSTQDKEA